jgi:hypothetical protein
MTATQATIATVIKGQLMKLIHCCTGASFLHREHAITERTEHPSAA